MTQEEREARREWRKNATKIKRAYNRLAKEKPSKEGFLKRGIMADIIHEPIYELKAEDYETLEPLFEAEIMQTFSIGGKDIEINGPLFPVQHLTYGNRHFIALIASTEEERIFLKYRLHEAVTFI